MWLVATLGIWAAPAPVAHAQTERDTATARALFEQGVELAKQQDWAGAADRFQRSNELRHSPVVAYNLATAWVEQGRLVEASELLRTIEKDETAKPAVKKDARHLLESLQPRIGTLIVVMEESTKQQQQQVQVNEQPLPEAALGVPTPIDPGSITVSVVDNGTILWTKRVEVLPGGEQRITIELPKQQPADQEPVTVPTPAETANRAVKEPPKTAGNDGGGRGMGADKDDRAFYEEPWVWVSAGVVVVAGVVVGVLLASGGSDPTAPEDDPITGSRLEPGTLRITP